jgi:hypothetical protein
MESHEVFKKKIVCLCEAFRKGMDYIKNWLDNTFKRLLKIANKEHKRLKNGQLKPSPKDILFP